MQIAKMMDGRFVQVVKTAVDVKFSSNKNWVMVCYDFDKPMRKQQEFRWFPASTKFEWVKEFVD